MSLSKLKKAPNYEVSNWLIKALDLDERQKRTLRDFEIIRFAPFDFYKDKNKSKRSIFWRFTLLLIPIYIPLCYLYLVLTFLVTGKWGVSRIFLDKFHYPWMNILGLNL